jgi:trafficking protein particle complex subunit 8
LDTICSWRRSIIRRQLVSQYAQIPISSHPYIFPLYNPATVDVVVFWEMPEYRRSGYVIVTGINIGVGHAPLQDMIGEVEEAKVKRSMYAETQVEKMEILQSIRNGEWNTETYPVVVTVQDGQRLTHDFSQGYESHFFSVVELSPIAPTDLVQQLPCSPCATTLGPTQYVLR